MSEALTHNICVSTDSRTYDVHVGRQILETVGEVVCQTCPTSTRVAVVSDTSVAPLYAERVLASLAKAGLEGSLVCFPAGEANKRMTTLEAILEKVASCGLTRDDCIVALGGGVAGDMGGLAAALYLRGCNVIQVPTSLLAMVDSSVGGKTAVDLAAGKNLVGAFFQPAAVIADVDVLTSIDHTLFTDSCGELIKHGVLADEALFCDLAAHPVNDPAYDYDHLVNIIARNVEIKRDVVDADERESGVRQTLNLGHTIGHAIEAASNFSLGHGASVAAGLCCVARAAATLGWCAKDVSRRIDECVASYGLPCDTSIAHTELMKYMMHDKKRHASGFNLIVPTAIGAVEIRRVTPDDMLHILELGCGTSPAKNA